MKVSIGCLFTTKKMYLLVFLRQWFARCQFADDIVQKANVEMALHCQLVVLFELIRPGNV